MDYSDSEQPSNRNRVLPALRRRGYPRSDIQQPREPHFQVSKASNSIQNNIKNAQLFTKRRIEQYENELQKIQGQIAQIEKKQDQNQTAYQKLMLLFNKATQTLYASKTQEIQLSSQIAALKQREKTKETQKEIQKLEMRMGLLRERIQGEINNRNSLKTRKDDCVYRSEHYSREMKKKMGQTQRLERALQKEQKTIRFIEIK